MVEQGTELGTGELEKKAYRAILETIIKNPRLVISSEGKDISGLAAVMRVLKHGDRKKC